MKQKLALRAWGLCATLLLFSSTIFAQKTVSGRVTDGKDGSAIAGASVTVKGTTVGTQTDSEGMFTLQVPANGRTLVISAVGFATQELSVDAPLGNISLAEAAGRLDEVVVVGYGTARKRDLTGSVGTVKEKDFLQGVFTAPDQAIQGKVAGVQIINNSGAPGGATTVRIRGISSIRSGNDPLFVVDGVPLAGTANPGVGTALGGQPANNPLNFINPADIETIDVLKDASATAIFGSRGANGVVLITTKKGKSGEPRIDVSSNVGFSSLLRRIDVLNGDEYRAQLQRYNIQGGNFGGNSDALAAITRTAVTTNQSIGITGGNENGRYRLSIGFLDQPGIIKESGFRKYTANFSGSFKFLQNKKLGLEFNLLTAQTKSNSAPISNDAGFQGSLIANALQWNPTADVKDWSPARPIDERLGATTINPLALLAAWDDVLQTTTVLASVAPYYKITNDLEYRILYSANLELGERRTELRNWINLDAVRDRGFAQLTNNRLLNQQLVHTLSYNKKVSSDLNINAVLGYEYLDFDFRGGGMIGRRFVDYPGLRYTDYMQNVTNADINIFSYRNPVTELQSLFTRATFNLKDKYLLTATVRRDGSTRFGENNKYGIFPSFAAAWNIDREDFLASSNSISNLKFRAGWGQTGNQEFPSGASRLRTGIGQAENTPVTTFPNPDLRWETNTMTNLGLDFGLFNDRLTGTLDWYSRSTTDALFAQNVVQPGPSGPRVWVNLDGEIVNSGLEVALNYQVVRNKDFNWSLGGNIAFQKNEIRGLTGFYETGALHGQGITGATVQRIVSGHPINVYYLRRFEGIDRNTGTSIYTDDGNTLFYSGSPNPTYIYGINTELGYKKWSLVMNMNGAGGHFLYNNTLNSVLPIGNLGTRNIARSIVTDIQESRANPIAPSTRYLEKGDYMKMANATLSYRVGNLGNSIRNMVLSLTAQNAFVITGFSGFDPEVNVDKNVQGIPSLGIEYVPYPTARNIILALSFGL